MGGNSQHLPPPEEEEEDDDDDDDDDGGDDGGQPSTKEPRTGIEGEKLLDEIARELGLDDDAPPPRPGPPGVDKPAHPDTKIPEGGPEHYFLGKAGDNIVYLNDDGESVKLNSRGHPNRINERGF